MTPSSLGSGVSAAVSSSSPKSLDEQISDIDKQILDAVAQGKLDDIKKFQDQKNILESQKSKLPQSSPTLMNISSLLKKKKLSDDEVKELKKLIKQHMQEYEHAQKNPAPNPENDKKIAIKDQEIADLLAKLHGSSAELQQKENTLQKKDREFDELLMANDKYSPAEYLRRKRLRTIITKFASKEDPKAQLLYFLSQTSFMKGGKITAGFKRLALKVSSFSHMNMMGTGQLSYIRNEIQKEVDRFRPDAEDSITVRLLKEKLRTHVQTSFNKLLETPEAKTPEIVLS